MANYYFAKLSEEKKSTIHILSGYLYLEYKSNANATATTGGYAAMNAAQRRYLAVRESIPVALTTKELILMPCHADDHFLLTFAVVMETEIKIFVMDSSNSDKRRRERTVSEHMAQLIKSNHFDRRGSLELPIQQNVINVSIKI